MNDLLATSRVGRARALGQTLDRHDWNSFIPL